MEAVLIAALIVFEMSCRKKKNLMHCTVQFLGSYQSERLEFSHCQP